VTWARVLHLAVGLWFAVACALVWPGLIDASPRSLAGLFLAPLPLLAVLACVPAVRRSEGVQARALLLPGDDQVTVESSRTWSDRGRLLVWLVVRVELGVLAGQLTVLAGTTAWSLASPAAAGASPVPGWAAVPLAVGVLVAAAYALAGLGALTAAVARRLLHPSLAERLATQQARTERLLERTRLAAELHDSIGHALTVTLLQAEAAREVAGRDTAFVSTALEAIADSARRAGADLERVLGLLRDPASASEDAPGLGELDRLVGSARAAGAAVTVSVAGPVGELPPALSREGYRVVQEALTNALRPAGPVPVEVAVAVHADRLEVRVANALPAAAVAGPGTGSGLRSLRERAAELGGTAEAGPCRDRWQVAVRLPREAAP
jgi:signal transduction histidine kinase